MVKLLLDTDIGTDIDDAVCLAYLLSNPECELLGITTVTGEAELRAMLASALCKSAGREVPIYPGAETPILLEQKQNRAAQAAALSAWPHDTRFPRGEAVEFMRRTIRRWPGEVILLTIAPLTNIGLLFSVDPEIPSLLRGLVMMCGRFFEPPPQGYGPVEWNALIDAHATSIVYRSRVPLHRTVGLDVTSKVTMTPEEFRATFARVPLFVPVLEWAEIWFKDWPGTTFHDPLAAATIFDAALCTYARGEVTIELDDASSRGLTRWSSAVSPAVHEVAVSVDGEGFFRHYLSVVGGKGVKP
ncbi:MAG: nucleoside hydrolase [Bacteroidota bacterium]